MVATPQRVVVRHDLGRTIAIVTWLVAAAVIVTDWPPSPAELLGAVGASGLAWVLGWRPAVIVDDDAVRVRNPLRDVAIGWAALDDAGFDWSLWVRAGDITCRAAAAPGPASMGALYDRRSSGGVMERQAVNDSRRRPPLALLAVRQRWAARAVAASDEVTVVRAGLAWIVLAASLLAAVGAVVTG